MKHALHDQIVPIDNSAPLAIKLLKEGHAEDLPGVLHGMATTHADVISADLPAFIKGQAAYRSGVLPRSAVQSTAQLNEWFRMTLVYASKGRRAPDARHRCSHRHTRPGCPARQPFTGHSLLRERASNSQWRPEGSKSEAGYRLYCDLPHLMAVAIT
jgi:hypothetical protein